MDEWARPLLIAHTLLAVALVAVSTHLVIWMSPWLVGRFQRVTAARRFALWSFGLYVGAFTLGNVIYPIYKMRVRSEFLEAPSVVSNEAAARQEERRAAQASQVPGLPLEPRRPGARRRAADFALWFDIKEHLVALGLALAAALAFLFRRWGPAIDRRLVPIAYAFAALAACCAWAAAVIGFAVASYRSVGPL